MEKTQGAAYTLMRQHLLEALVMSETRINMHKLTSTNMLMACSLEDENTFDLGILAHPELLLDRAFQMLDISQNSIIVRVNDRIVTAVYITVQIWTNASKKRCGSQPSLSQSELQMDD